MDKEELNFLDKKLAWVDVAKQELAHITYGC